MAAKPAERVELDVDQSIWERFFSVHPLVVVGTAEPDGSHDLAPKHLAMPVSWQNFFGFVCSERHATCRNIRRTGHFTVSFVRPSQTVLAALAASPRCEDGSKPIVAALPTVPARSIDGVLLADAYLFLECTSHQIVENLGDNVLIVGRIVAAQVASDAVRDSERDGQDVVRDAPLLAYLYPDRFAEIRDTNQLPFPAGFKR